MGIATIRRAKADGVDVQDRNAFAAWALGKKKRPDAWINGIPWEQDNKTSSPHAATDDERDLMEKVKNAANYDEARTYKTQIDAIHKLRQIQILEGEYIHRDEVKNDITRIGSAVLAAHKQCQADLPAILEGLTAAQAKKKIAEYMRKIDMMLADESSNLYQKEE